MHTAFRVLGNTSEAEEVVQDVFLYLYKRSDLFDPSKGSLKAWILQITLCRAIDRKSYITRRRISFTDLDTVDLAEGCDPETQLDTKFSRKHLEAALQDLTQMQRRTIEFFYFEGLDLKEISIQLRQPLANVRHHFYRGLKRLSKNAVLHKLCRK